MITLWIYHRYHSCELYTSGCMVLEACADPNRCGPNQVAPPTREAKQVKRKKEEDFTEILCSPPEVNNRPKATHSHSSKSCCCVVTAW